MMMDLELARRAAAKSQAKRDVELRRFEESQQFRRALDRYHVAWNDWAGTWENIVLSRQGRLIGESGEVDLAEALQGLVEVTRERGFIEQLPIAAERYDPSYCDGTDDEEEAYAVKIVVGLLNEVANGTDATEVARKLLSLDPLPLLFRAGSARHLLRIADHWPNHCESCGQVQSPDTFDGAFCLSCNQNGESMRLGFMNNQKRRPIAAPSKLIESIKKLDLEIAAILRTVGLYEVGWKNTEAAQRLIDYLVANTDDDIALIEATYVRPAIQRAKELFESRASNISTDKANANKNELPPVKTPEDENAKFERLRLLTPELDVKSMDWVESNHVNTEILKLSVGTLAKYRDKTHGLYRSTDRLFGVDKAGRIWRKPEGYDNPDDAPTYYLRSSLPKA